MNPFLRYLADKNSAHTQTDRHTHTHRQTDRHTPMITIPCGLRRAGNLFNRPFSGGYSSSLGGINKKGLQSRTFRDWEAGFLQAGCPSCCPCHIAEVLQLKHFVSFLPINIEPAGLVKFL